MSGSIAAYGEGYNFTTAYAAVSTSTPEFPGAPLAVGTRVNGTAGATWIFVKAGGTVAAGDVCLITTNSTWIAEAMTSTLAKGKLGQMVGVAGAVATVGQFFWMQIAGYKVPKSYEFRSEPLPRSAAGKILKRELRDAQAGEGQ